MTIGAEIDGNAYLLRASHGRWETSVVAKMVAEQSILMRGRFGERYTGDYVEDKVSGSTLIQYLRRSNPDCVVIPIRAERDKVARAHGVTPLCEAARVLFPDAALFPESRAWTDDLITNLLTFPVAQHDDLTDAFVYAVRWFSGSGVRTVSRFGKCGGMV